MMSWGEGPPSTFNAQWDIAMEVMRETSALGFTVFPIIFAAFLAYYARAMSKKGVLS